MNSKVDSDDSSVSWVVLVLSSFVHLQLCAGVSGRGAQHSVPCSGGQPRGRRGVGPLSETVLTPRQQRRAAGDV